MIYSPVYLSSFEKDIKKIDKILKQKIKSFVYEILKNPFLVNELTGDLKGFRSYHLKLNKVE